ncbi:RGCVC family protein [Lentzea sp.]|uniref:RGCVC family protein n=1 Tax=Lentzea sp. TaxID=56099 RepID=UPI0039C8FF1B
MPTSLPLIIDVDDQPDTTGGCAVCPHPRAGHDALSVRYCTATAVSALPRGCICP